MASNVPLPKESKIPIMSRRAGLRFIAIFIATFSALQLAMIKTEGTAIERALIDQATVSVAAAVTGLVFSQDNVRADGYTIVSSRVRLSVLRGCEGTEVLFLVIAASLAFPASWRSRLFAMMAGLVLAYTLNQLRIVMLYYTVRDARRYFELAHGYIAPTLLVAAVALFFWWWATASATASRSGIAES